MMDVRITPRPLKGTIAAPASKSEAHRLLICAALADRPSRLVLEPSALSWDLEATSGCLRALGAKITPMQGPEPGLYVEPIETPPRRAALDCGESGSTLRFLLPVAAALCDEAVFTGKGQLPQRPIDGLLAAMKGHGVTFGSKRLPLEVKGRLQPGTYQVPGDVSSQYVSGLLLALPLMGSGAKVVLTSPLRSAEYVDITADALDRFGVKLQIGEGTYETEGEYHAPFGPVPVGGDWSNGAFFLAAGALSGGEGVVVNGLDRESPQGDRRALRLLKRFGAKIKTRLGRCAATSERLALEGLNWIDIDINPDLLPILAVMAACCVGEMRFVNGARLRLKESDRLASAAALIRSLGGEAVEGQDRLTVTGGRPLWGGTVDGAGDHRIVMAAAVAAIRCHSPVLITGAEAVEKSYPAFFDDYRALGGEVDVL